MTTGQAWLLRLWLHSRTSSRNPTNFDINNPQSVFDHVVSSIIAQGRPSIGTITRCGRAEVICMYRGEGGAKCAAGWCIPDDKYTPEIEGLAAYTFEVRALIGAPSPVTSLINQLQGAHDNSADGIMSAERFAEVTPEQFIADFKVKARKIAGGFNLDASAAR